MFVDFVLEFVFSFADVFCSTCFAQTTNDLFFFNILYF